LILLLREATAHCRMLGQGTGTQEGTGAACMSRPGGGGSRSFASQWVARPRDVSADKSFAAEPGVGRSEPLAIAALFANAGPPEIQRARGLGIWLPRELGRSISVWRGVSAARG
jgi:hypothetical protein